MELDKDMNNNEMKNRFIQWVKDRYRESFKRFYLKSGNEYRAMYDKLVENIFDFNGVVYFEGAELEIIKRICRECKRDNPVFFFAEVDHYRYSDRGVTAYLLYDEYTAEELYRVAVVMDKTLKKVRMLCNGKDPVEKEKIVHDCIVEEIRYKKIEDAKYSVYEAPSVFMSNFAVCSGISKAANILLNHVGVESFLVRGDAYSNQEHTECGPHMWNMVRLYGQLYHVDITFDNTISPEGYKSYSYFNLTDRQIMNDHMPDGDTPSSAETEYDYFIRNGLACYSRDELETQLKKAFKNNEDFFTLRICFDLKEKVSDIVFDVLFRTRHFINDGGKKYFSSYIADTSSVMVYKR